MRTIRRGNIVADDTILAEIPAAAVKVRSWQSGISPKAQDAMYALAKARGWLCESVLGFYGHKRLYVLLVYPAGETGWKIGRRNCFDTLAATSPL